MAASTGNTSGILIVFNAKGEAKLRANPALRDVVAFLDRVRVPGANAFAINILRAESEPAGMQFQAAAGEHRDGAYGL